MQDGRRAKDAPVEKPRDDIERSGHEVHIAELRFNWMLPLLGAIGFGIGFALACAINETIYDIAVNAFADVFPGTRVGPEVGILRGVIAGGIGGAALGLAFKDRMQAIYFSLTGAIGFAIAFTLAVSLGPSLGILIGRDLGVGAIVGAIGGFVMGLASTRGRIASSLMLSAVGAVWFACAFAIGATVLSGGLCSSWNGWGGAVGGVIFGLTLAAYHRASSRRSAMIQRGAPSNGGLDLIWVAGNTVIWVMWPWIAALCGLAMWLLHDHQLTSERIDTQFLGSLFQQVSSDVVAMVLLAIVFGAVLGSFQQALLSRRLHTAIRMWVPATMAGVLLMTLVSFFGLAWFPTVLMRLVLQLGWLLPLGIVHWLVLRKRVSKAASWVAATAFASLIPTSLMLSWPAGPEGAMLVRMVVENTASGLAYGVATLLAMITLSRPSTTSASETR